MRFTYQNGSRPLEGYTIHHGIHRGGFGEVYYAHSDGGKEVALKLLHGEDSETELRGVTQCLNLKHPNLINIFDLRTDALGDQWIVMEYVSGSNLEDVLASFPKGLPLTDVREWLSGLVAGVAFLHDRGIVHRDLKPANTYRENSVVKVGDVGLSKQLDSETRRRHTQSVGTVYYMAPEVAQGKYGPEVDVYSLGVMIYEMITGTLPFTGETTAEILMKHLTAQPNLMPIPQSLRPVIAHALEKDPHRRTPSVRQLELEFLRAVQSSPAGAAFSDTPEPHARAWESTAAPQRPPEKQRGKDQPQWSSPMSHVAAFPKPAPVFPGLIFAYIFVVLILISNGTSGVTIVSWGRLMLFGMPILLFLAVREFQGKQRKSKPSRESFQRFPETLRRGPFRRCADFDGIPYAEPADENPRPDKMPAGYGAGFKTKAAATADRVLNPRYGLLAEMGHSLGIAGMVACVLSIGCYLLQLTQFRTPILPSTEHAVLFASVTMIGSWLILISHQLSNRWALSRRRRWLSRMAVGAVLGSCAFGLQQFLTVHVPSSAFTMRSAFHALGSHQLSVAGTDPTWLGYAVFFAAWLGLRKNPREMDEHRGQRFQLGLTIKSVFLGFLASVVFAFPQWYALLWAGAISATLQFASPWVPSQRYVRGR